MRGPAGRRSVAPAKIQMAARTATPATATAKAARLAATRNDAGFRRRFPNRPTTATSARQPAPAVRYRLTSCSGKTLMAPTDVISASGCGGGRHSRTAPRKATMAAPAASTVAGMTSIGPGSLAGDLTT